MLMASPLSIEPAFWYQSLDFLNRLKGQMPYKRERIGTYKANGPPLSQKNLNMDSHSLDVSKLELFDKFLWIYDIS